MVDQKWMSAVSRLAAVREARNMTLKTLSEESGIPLPTISRWLRGDAVPPVDKLEVLACALDTSVAYILGEGGSYRIPILGEVKCGPNGVIRPEHGEYSYADIARPEQHFFLRAKGNSMEPRIIEGDLVLIREQDDAENGEIVYVVYEDEFEPMQTLKKLVRRRGATIQQPLNPSVEAMVFMGEEQNRLHIVGKAIRVYGAL